ncbi:MAG: hypothetical protein HYR91_08490 [Flavobacteriia bacterium]|nr:hypothetical protein [Flavobacteriia bacterium]
MKNFLKIFLFLCIPLMAKAQNVIPFIDFNNYFENFHDGAFSIVDFQQIRNMQAGDECAVYTDFKSNLVVYNGSTKMNLANVNSKFQVSDHLVAWQIGPTLNMWDDGKLRTLTYNSIDYVVKDSIVVYSDFRYNSVNVYWKGEIYPLYTVVDEIYMPEFIGENVIVFKDNGNFYKIFWNGKIYDIGVWNGSITFDGGTDIVAFNDPTTRTFTVFDKGQLIEVESFFMNKYNAGRGFVVYEDLNNNLKLYKANETIKISNFSASKFEVKDDVILWVENNYFKTYFNDEVKTICNFTPIDYLLKNNVIAYRNVMGGVSAFVDGINVEITNQKDAEYSIFGSSVLVKLFNNSYIVLQKGVKFSK